MGRRVIRFDGPEAESALSIGYHLTVRLASHYPLGTHADEGDYVIVAAGRRAAIAKVSQRVEEVTFDGIRRMRWQKTQRAPFREPENLINALREFYPASDEYTLFVALMLDVFLVSVP